MNNPAYPECTPQTLTESTGEIPSVAFIISGLQRLLASPKTSVADVGELVRLDPSLAARILKISNSVLYRGEEKCNSIDESLCRVGFNDVHRLVTMVASGSLIAKPLEVYGMSAEQAWHHSVGCALASQHMAEILGENPSVAYTVGLLHALGRQPIDTFLLRKDEEMLLSDAGTPDHFAAAETDLFGFTQETVTASLLEYWTFPELITEPIGILASTTNNGTSESRMKAVVDIARMVYDCSFFLGCRDLPGPVEGAIEQVNLSVGDFRDLCGQLREDVARAIEISHF